MTGLDDYVEARHPAPGKDSQLVDIMPESFNATSFNFLSAIINTTVFIQ